MHSTLFLLNVCVFCFCSISFLLFFNSGNLTIEENSSSRAGLKSDLSIYCSACDESTPWQTSPNITKKGKSFDVNRRAVYHAIESGTGFEENWFLRELVLSDGKTFHSWW